MDKAVRAALTVLFASVGSDEFKTAKKVADKKAAFSSEFSIQMTRLEAGPFVAGADKEIVESTVSEFADEVAEALKKDEVAEECEKYINIKAIAIAGIWGVYHEDMPGLDHTGIVFAGYGNREFFPSAIVFDCYGLLNGKVSVCEKKDGRFKIDQDQNSWVEPMAKSDMIHTFVNGIGFGARNEIDKLLEKAMDDLSDAFMRDNDIKSWDKLEEKNSEAQMGFRNSVYRYMFTHHDIPMRQVVGMLPVDELADLAETLIYMESLKERVTAPDESVSGLIDVAVISKSDGFIWIKRKHYFDPKLNPDILWLTT